MPPISRPGAQLLQLPVQLGNGLVLLLQTLARPLAVRFLPGKILRQPLHLGTTLADALAHRWRGCGGLRRVLRRRPAAGPGRRRHDKTNCGDELQTAHL